MSVRVVITQGITADCTQTSRLIVGIISEYLLADRGYDSDAIVEQARTKGMNLVYHLAGTERHKEIMTQNSIVYVTL